MAVGYQRKKPEHMTHLDHRTLVAKDHPRIAFRGWIDRLESEILLCRMEVAKGGHPDLAAELDELLDFVRRFIRADVLGERVEAIRLGGYTEEELRELSHHPEKYFGQPHFMASGEDDPAILYLNRLRALIRQGELAAYRAFKRYDGTLLRPDIQMAMNRLSSLCWIWQIKLKAGKYPRRGTGG